MVKITDKDNKFMDLRYNNLGAVLIKGKRQIFFIFKSVNAGNRARKLITNFSFNQLFNKGKKIKVLGNNISHIKID